MRPGSLFLSKWFSVAALVAMLKLVREEEKKNQLIKSHLENIGQSKRPHVSVLKIKSGGG